MFVFSGCRSFHRRMNVRRHGFRSYVRDFVPAKNASGVVGMYDLVGGRFYENAGTGDFIAGDPVVE